MSYTKISEKFIENINSKVSVYSHDKTKARIMTFENDDMNKVFSIAFRTPAINNCGLTHILEHSVLCGSKKYPLKDPFVELLKGSLNTFLNAMTFPDKTMYPVASMNSKDFRNLMNVYLDAVFYPNVTKNSNIFKQEGWHYEIEDKNAPITINGVVYNEMKGAYSDPLSVLSRYIMHSLYKDNSYGFESGGDPKEIPNLSYEEFTKFYKDYYSPSNAYIFLYGNTNMEDDMKFIENEYLNNFDYNNFDTTLKKSKINTYTEEEYFYNSASDDDKPYYSYNVALKGFDKFKENSALSTAITLLFNVPGAKIRERLMKEGIADDIDASIETELAEPFLSIVAIGADKDKKERFKEIIEEELENVSLDKDSIIAQLKYADFKIRENKQGSYPRGLSYQMDALKSWLYDDSMPYDSLDRYKYIEELMNEDLEYFYNIINEYIVSNPHKSFVSLTPKKGLLEEEENSLKEKLEVYKNSLSSEEILKLINDSKALKEYQMEKDTDEAIATLPHLTLEDLKTDPENYKISEIKDVDFKAYYSDYFTNKIVYTDFMFDITDFDVEDIKHAALLSMILGLVNTTKHKYSELNKLAKLYTGGLNFLVDVIELQNDMYKVYFRCNLSALKNEYDNATTLTKELLFNSLFDDKARFKELINMFKTNMDQGVSDNGHSFAVTRAGSYISERYYILESISGIEFMDYMADIMNNFDDKYLMLKDKFNELIKRMFVKERFVLDYTTDNVNKDYVLNNAKELYNTLAHGMIGERKPIKLNVLNEGIETPFDANFIARFAKIDPKYNNGAMAVLKKAISLDYLWQNVRVLGGAYGCMIQVSRTNDLTLVSYRDPNSIKTDEIYKNTYKFIEELNPTTEDLLKYKIGACSGFEADLHASQKGRVAFKYLMTGVSYEYRKNLKLEMIATTKENLVNLSDCFKESLKNSAICALVSKKGLQESKELYNNVRRLKK